MDGSSPGQVFANTAGSRRYIEPGAAVGARSPEQLGFEDVLAGHCR